MPRSSITATVQRVQGLVDQVNALNPDEYAFFLDLLMPEPEAAAEEPKPKKTRKKRGPNRTRRGMPPQENAPLLTPVSSEADDPGPRCYLCGNYEDFQDHSKPSPNYHQFKTAA